MARSIKLTTSLLALFAGMSLAGCATAPMPGAVVYCQIEKPISWSKKDTDQTIREVKGHNAVYKALCS